MKNFVICLIIICLKNFTRCQSVDTYLRPEFLQPIQNQTVPIGRDATLSCYVSNLGGYRVGWVRTEDKAIQAIHENVITHNSRVWVSHNDFITWNLHIKDVQEDDRGQYMCQINTNPMRSQIGYLDVVIPPDIIYEETSTDVMVSEGATVKLVCRARGYPKPNIIWRRENNENIMNKEPWINREREYEGEILKLTRISRLEMGAYLCIASNGVPPSVSKRIIVNVHFHPVIQVPNQLVGAPRGTDVTIECNVEAYPKPIVYWLKETGDMVATNEKFETKIEIKSIFETKMILRIKNFQSSDAGTYTCNSKNSVGGVESMIRLYDISAATSDTNENGYKIWTTLKPSIVKHPSKPTDVVVNLSTFDETFDLNKTESNVLLTTSPSTAVALYYHFEYYFIILILFY